MGRRVDYHTSKFRFNQTMTGIIDVAAAHGYQADGLTSSASANLAALTAAIAAAPVTGCILQMPPGRGFVNGKIVINKPITLRGHGYDATIIDTTSATLDLIETTVEHIIIEDLQLAASTVTKTAGAHINSTSGAGGRSLQVSRVRFDEAFRGIRNATGFLWIDNCIITILNATGIGIVCVNGAGLYCTKTFIGSDNLDVNNQPIAGIDLSDCGNAVIDNCQFLAAGYGIKANPDTAGQVCTSLFLSNVLSDHCVVGFYFAPYGSTQNVSVITMVNCWGCSSNSSGLLVSPTNGATVGAITISNSIFASNGHGVGSDGVVFTGGNVNKVTISTCIIYDHPNAADIGVRGAAREFLIQNNQIGIDGFPSSVGVAIADTSDFVMATGNLIAPHTSSYISNTSSGTHNITTPNMLVS